MGKTFTITEGLENLGALKTGGQGSVYKGKRLGEIFTAIKLLPTPIHTESIEDKNFRDFNNEVEKLKKVNEKPNPNVVKILNSGITDTGNFPFIEMEFIEGPDLEELLKAPHDAVFSVKEIIKVAEHLSNALAHCHGIEVKHGDIKTNNVKFNIHTGNYVLLDFGLAIMSDEQRRTSLRHAGAIEFMAPEQNEGKMLFQTDVYSFGIVLFELVAGIVPFPLKDKGETARNKVMLAHMEVPPPDVVQLRQQNLPMKWSAEKKEQQMHVPSWLISMIYKCLEKNPVKRFANGIELHDYILLNSSFATAKQESNTVLLDGIQQENQKLLLEKEQLQQSLMKNQQELAQLKQSVHSRDSELQLLKQKTKNQPAVQQRPGFSAPAFYTLLLITALLAAFAGYSLLSEKSNTGIEPATVPSNSPADTQAYQAQGPVNGNTQNLPDTIKKNTERFSDSAKSDMQTQSDPMLFDTAATTAKDTVTSSTSGKALRKYKVASKAFFYNEPDEATRREAFILPGNNVIFQALEEKNGFIYVIFTNEQDQTYRGWLLKTDLIAVND